MSRRILAILALIALGSTWQSCSCTTAGSFKECERDTDCGTAAACSQGYCLDLPAGCRREEAGGTVRAFETGDRIPLAALLPLSSMGVEDNSEVQGLSALKLAVSEVNDRNGLKSRNFGLFVCNTDKVPETTRLQTEWMIQNLQVPAIIASGTDQTQTVAKDPVRLDAGTMIMSATATGPSLISTHQNEGNVWRVAPPDTQQATALAKLIKLDFPDAGGVTVDVIYEDTDYGGGFGQPMAEALIAQGFRNNRRPFKPEDAQSQTMVINGLSNEPPKATVLIAFPKDAIELITRAKTFPALTRAGGHRWYLTDATKDPAVLTAVTLPELVGTIGTAPAQGAGGSFAAFRDSFRTRYGTDPLTFSYTSHSYDAMWLVMLSAASAESTGQITGPKLGEGMGKLSAPGASIPLRVDKWTEASNLLLQGLTINAEGASGALDFDVDAGNPTAPYEVWQVEPDAGIRVLRLTNP